MKHLRTILAYSLITAFLVICLGNSVSGLSAAKQENNELYEKLELFSTVLALIQSSYYKTISSKNLIYGALKGTLGSLDPYSQFLPPKTYKELQIETEGEFGGLGLEIVFQDNALFVLGLVPGSPAAASEIQPKDIITHINGLSVLALSFNDAIDKLRGPVGAPISLTLSRPSKKHSFKVNLVRKIIQMKSVVSDHVLSDTKIAYIKITQFQSGTSEEVLTSLEKLEKQDIKGLIFDLRNNPGGLLDEGIRLSGILVGDKQLIVSTKGRPPEQTENKYSKSPPHTVSHPYVLLINQRTASSAEIVSGAVQDLKKGILLGTKTYGKASVQSLIPLKDGSALRLTTALYYTPKGRLIHEKGIVPDIEVALSKEDLAHYSKNRAPPLQHSEETYKDAQIQKAIAILNQWNPKSR